MNKTDKLLEDKFISGRFTFSVFPKFKVRVKEIIEKHNKEIKWKFGEKNARNEEGERAIEFELVISEEGLSNLSEKMDLFVGLIEDIHNSVGGGVSEELAEKYNQGFIGVATGEELLKEDIEIKNMDRKKNYFYVQHYDNSLMIVGDMNKVIEVERLYPRVVGRVFGTLVQEWYEQNVRILNKIFPDKKEFELALAIVQKLEKSNIKKAPYNLKKFRFFC